MPPTYRANDRLDEKKKKHRVRQSGPKADKKQLKDKKAPSHNVKAFAVQHTTKAARLVQRTLDYQTKKQHLPQSSHVVDASPPMVVALVGPPKSGKTTLLKSLIKHFARQAVNVVKGPLTVVVGKKVRLTFIECGCDINSMLDAAKIADVVLLMVNVRTGLEMYHFEFINMVQVHGMPRVIPVLNHLDTYKDSSSSRAVRRKIKQRLWVDLNSKIFLLSRFQPKKYPTSEEPANEFSKPGDYLIAEVRRLARMIIVKIPRATDWRTSHPYMLIDRLEDITDSTLLSESPHADRTVSMYGWVRGAPLPPALTSPGIHIAGLGDFTLADCTRQPDPCPLPNQIAAMANTASSTGKPSRHLAERDRKIYAPMSSLGGVLFDRDATYIDLGGSHYLTQQRQRGGHSQVVTQTALDEVHATFGHLGGLDEQMESEHRVRILGDTPYLLGKQIGMDDEEMNTATDTSDNEKEDSDEEDDQSTESTASVTQTESVEDAKVFSDNLFAGFLVPAGTEPSGQPPAETRKHHQSSSPNKNVHLEVKQVLDDIDWRTTRPARINWNRIIYGQVQSSGNDEATTKSMVDGLFRVPSQQGFDDHPMTVRTHDFTIPLRFGISASPPTDWTDPGVLERIANRFTTGQWDASEDAQTLLQTDAQARAALAAQEAHKYAAASASKVRYKGASDGYSEEEMEDVEGGEAGEEEDAADTYDTSDESDAEMASDEDVFAGSDKQSGDSGGQESDAEKDDPNAEFEKRLLRPTKRQKLLEKRKRHKALFEKLYEAAGGGSEATAFYDKLLAAKEAQLAANRAVLQSLSEEAVEQLEGFPPGAYVRLEFRGIPYQFIDRFNPCQPLVAGGLPSAEEAKGYIQVRFRTHRWLKRVLRSNDPITVSIGWRRYQTVGVFSKEEHNLRNRFLKYSLPHEHCLVTIYGPLVPAKTGVTLFVNSAWRPQSDASGLPTFRVAGTGSVTATDQSFQIMKKLKLIGEPYKIFSKTAFIRGMFNSALEVSKMVGARIQTVSNIRGLIKSALTNPSVSQPGDFRATFEAQLRRSDLVFLRTFVAVELPRYYNPVLNRLCPVEGEEEVGPGNTHGWRLMRTLTELRKETGVKVAVNADSHYKPIQRPVHVPTPLYVPTKLVAALPFAQKPKMSKKIARELLGGDKVKAAVFGDLPPPIKAAADRNMETREELLSRLRQLHADYKQRQRAKMVARVSKHKQEMAKLEQKRLANERQRRKAFFARQGGRRKGKKGGRSE
ncbi:ribosome biogenesis protein BMS1 [Clonorchis sinensis]|uniref:Ribosome biogenesis protein BMS1 n=1 Tax=Clonorchis sinensis TaxID=79923 RepID=G7YBL2_CLOSI|nr:ribosome biogenesis protein BMS1 [Clonorchis sinensis]